MYKDFKIKPPFFEIGPKAFLYGEKMLELAKVIDKTAIKYDLDVIVTPQYTDIKLLADNTERILVFAQHMDYLTPGRGLGSVLPEAVKAADAALAIDPSYVPAVLHKALALVNLGDMDGADALLESASGDFRSRKMQANICIRKKDFARARDKAASVTDENPEDDEAWSLLGAAYAYLGEREKAAEAFSRAVSLNPREKSYRANLMAVKREKQ